MLFYKSSHCYGLDYLIYQKTKNNTYLKNYYLYIWDYACTETKTPLNFYHKECNKDNTWNYNLKFENTSKESIVKKCFELIKIGVDSIHTNSWNINFIKYVSDFKIPIQGHVGFVPMKSTWTGGVRPFGKTSAEAVKLINDIKELWKS